MAIAVASMPEDRVVVDEEPLPTVEGRLMFITQERCDITYGSSSFALLTSGVAKCMAGLLILMQTRAADGYKEEGETAQRSDVWTSVWTSLMDFVAFFSGALGQIDSLKIRLQSKGFKLDQNTAVLRKIESFAK
jgi:hypothetical protein